MTEHVAENGNKQGIKLQGNMEGTYCLSLPATDVHRSDYVTLSSANGFIQITFRLEVTGRLEYVDLIILSSCFRITF